MTKRLIEKEIESFEDEKSTTTTTDDESLEAVETEIIIQKEEKESSVTFVGLIRSNKPFRLVLSSFVLARIGGWLTYIASIQLIEDALEQQSLEQQPDRESFSSSRSAIGILIACRLLPIVLASSTIGGALADQFDRHKMMIYIDMISSLACILFMLAKETNSIVLVYLATICQQTLAGLYEPCRSAIMTMVVSNDEELKKATTLTGLCWSVFAAFGSTLGGFIASRLGLTSCFGMYPQILFYVLLCHHYEM